MPRVGTYSPRPDVQGGMRGWGDRVQLPMAGDFINHAYVMRLPAKSQRASRLGNQNTYGSKLHED